MKLVHLAHRGWFGGIIANMLCLFVVSIAYSMARGNFFGSPDYLVRVAIALGKVGTIFAIAFLITCSMIPHGQCLAVWVLSRRAQRGLCLSCRYPLADSGLCTECGRSNPAVSDTSMWWSGFLRGTLVVVVMNVTVLCAFEAVVGADEIAAVRASERAFASGRTTALSWQRPFPCSQYTILFGPDGKVGVWGE